MGVEGCRGVRAVGNLCDGSAQCNRGPGVSVVPMATAIHASGMRKATHWGLPMVLGIQQEDLRGHQTMNASMRSQKQHLLHNTTQHKPARRQDLWLGRAHSVESDVCLYSGDRARQLKWRGGIHCPDCAFICVGGG